MRQLPLGAALVALVVVLRAIESHLRRSRCRRHAYGGPVALLGDEEVVYLSGGINNFSEV